MTTARTVLENIGCSLTVTVLWFIWIPRLVSGTLKISYRPGFGFGLALSAVAVFVGMLFLAFGMHLTLPAHLFFWHLFIFLLSYLAVDAVTKGDAYAIAIPILIIIIISAISHAIEALVILPTIFAPNP